MADSTTTNGGAAEETKAAAAGPAAEKKSAPPAALASSSCSMAPPSSKKRKAASSAAGDAAASRPRTAAAAASGGNGGGAHHHPSSASAIAAAAKESREQLHADLSYTPLTLQDIHDRFRQLCYKVPTIPEPGFASIVVGGGGEAGTAAVPSPSSPAEEAAQPKEAAKDAALPQPSGDGVRALKEWAMRMQAVVEELSVLMGCVYPATYVWGTDRSGAADQNLSLLNNELARSQDYIATLVTPRLTDVLTPAMSLVTKRTVTTKDEATGAEVKVNHFETTPEDPNYVQFGIVALARNAPMLRHVVLANIDKMLQAIKDYLAAQQKDSQHDSRGFVY